MSSASDHPRPSPKIARTVWLWGVAITLAMWAAVATTLLGDETVTATGQVRLAGAFALFAAGWTGAYLYRRTRRPEPGAH